MKSDEIKKIFPSIKIPISDKLGYAEFTVKFIPDSHVSNGEDDPKDLIDTEIYKDFRGWKSLKVESIDDKLVSLEVQYDNSVKWKNVAEFIKYFSKPNKLPTDWRIGVKPEYYTEASLTCNGFSIDIDMSGQASPTVYILDSEAAKTLDKRKSEIEEKAKKAFKPR